MLKAFCIRYKICYIKIKLIIINGVKNMCEQIIEKFKEKRCFFIVPFLVGLFLLMLTLYIAFLIPNKIKEGKYIGKPPEVQNTISFTGTGEVFVKPDLALITFSVQNEAKTVADAMSENTKKMNAVIDSIKKQGVQDKDLKTASFNISPRYEWPQIRCLSYPCPTGERVLVGYDVYQSLQVKIRNLEKVGSIIQSATDMGANDVSGLQFTVENEDELKSQARKQAIDEARAKAKELASQLGVNLGAITNFSESGSWPVPIPYFARAEMVGVGEAPQIQTGENKIEVTVTITYEIR